MGKIKKFINDHMIEILLAVFGTGCLGVGAWLGYIAGKADGFDDGVTTTADMCNSVFRMEATMLVDACKEGAVAGLTENPPTNLDALKEAIVNGINDTEMVREFNNSADYKFVKITKF